ncbi:MAG TPA: PIN domain-containing protein [Anaerolineae bacterium]|nr:PIN domain-containing protein [Anaerolineae bacterium]HMR67325.1 PIN domain-containing protein [Anaerolineae bacterium]
MKILVDTNVILDITLERQPFFEQSVRLLQVVTQLDIEVCVTATTVTDLYYIIRKAKGREVALSFVEDLLNFVEIAAVDKDVIAHALQLRMTDFEDAIQVSAAKYKGISIIITRNEADFRDSDLKIHSPESFLNSVSL